MGPHSAYGLFLTKIIRDGAKINSFPKLIENDVKNNYMEEVVNSFNNNTGPDLAREILDPGPDGEHVGKLVWNHPQFNFPQKGEIEGHFRP